MTPGWDTGNPRSRTARLRALKTDKNTLLLKVNMGAGHGGASGRYDALRDIALRYAFLFDVMGIQAQPARAAEAAKP